MLRVFGWQTAKQSTVVSIISSCHTCTGMPRGYYDRVTWTTNAVGGGL